MRKTTFFSTVLTLGLFVGLVSCTGAKYDYQTVENDPLNTKIYTLPNGLKVYMTVNKEQPRIQTYIAVKTGSKNDPSDATGLAHYLEHMMFKGTTQFGTLDYEAEKPLLDTLSTLFEIYRTRTTTESRKAIYHVIDSISGEAAKYAIPNEYDRMMAQIGADGTNASTTEDVTYYTEDIPSNQIENWAKIQSERFRNPVFRLFHTELESIYEEKNISLANDTRREKQVIEQVLMPNHPYGQHTIIGSTEHLKNPSLVNIQKYYDTWYVPNNMAVCLSGDFEPDNMIDIISRYFTTWKASDSLPTPTFPVIEPLTKVVTTELWGQEAENVMIGWNFPGEVTEDGETMCYVANLLSNGKAGLIDIDLVQAQKVAKAGVMVEPRAEASTLMLYGVPLPGQSLEEVRDLLLAEVQKLASAEFDEEFVRSTMTDYKLMYERMLEDNEGRASMLVDCFVYDKTIEHAMGILDRLSQLDRMRLAHFARKNLQDRKYVVVFKRQGEDPSRQIMEKLEITPVPVNRDVISAFAQDIITSEVKPIEPVFVDYETDLQKGQLNKGQPFYYKKNEQSKLFELYYVYDMGRWSDKYLPLVSHYADLLGTDTMTPEDVKRAYYRIGCEYKLIVSNRRLFARIRGLDENLNAAIDLTERVIVESKSDPEVFCKFRDNVIQQRAIAMNNQRRISTQSWAYAAYGPEYIKAVNVSREELNQLKESDLVDRLHNLGKVNYKVFYYGPRSMAEVMEMCNLWHKTSDQLQPLKFESYRRKIEPKEHITYVVPYRTNNSVLRINTAFGDSFDPSLSAKVALYNEYFAGPMNSVIFQEMREANGLTYSANAKLVEPDFKSGFYSYYAQISTQTEKLEEAHLHLAEIIDNMPLSEPAFENAKHALLNRLRTQRTVRADVLWSYLDAQDVELTEDPNKQIFEQVQQLTLQDLVDFQQKYFKGLKYSHAVLGDPKLLVLKTFEEEGKVVRLTVDDIFGW